MRFIVVALTCLFFSIPSFAQYELQDSHEVIQKGVDMYDKEEYKRAIELYRQVHECDTNYALAVYEEVLALIADSQFLEAKKLAAASVGMRYGYKRDALLQLASCYDFLQKQDSALMLYDMLIRMYPNDNLPLYEKGVVYFGQKDYDGAAYWFERSLVINSNHFKSHYMLGKTYTLQGRLSEAMMALETSLLVTKSPEQAKLSIAVISAIVEETDEVKKAYSGKATKYSNPSYDEIDQFINARVAIDPAYKLKMTINDNIFRQSQLMMEKLKFDPSDTSFSMQFYVPFFSEAYKQDMFEGTMLLAYSEFGLESVDLVAKHKKKVLDDARQLVFGDINKLQSTRVVNYEARKTAKERYHYLPENDLFMIGDLDSKGTSLTGDAIVYRLDQSLLAVGKYDKDGLKTGDWKYYFKNGNLMKEATYRNDTTIGVMKEYWTNGNLNKITEIDNNAEITREESYNYKGWKSGVIKLLSPGVTEESTFHRSGQKEVTAVFNNKKIKDGTYTFYLENGKPDKVVSFKNGDYSGPYKKYFESGGVNEESAFENGQLEGASIVYFENGKINKKTNYRNGKPEGAYESFYEDGTPEETCSYKRGKKDGIDKGYTREGKLYEETEYENDVPVSLKYMKPDGSVIVQKEDPHGIYEYAAYYDNGNKSMELKLNADGTLDGLATYYYYTGPKSTDIVWKWGVKEGKATTYYKNGKIKAEQNFVKDALDGAYRAYYQDGTVQVTGFYKEGKKQGPWKYYNVSGKLQSEAYFEADEWNGYTLDYDVSGRRQFKYMFDYGMMTGCVLYDTAGARIDSISYASAKGRYQVPSRTFPKKIDQDGNLLYGALDGPFSNRYMNGQVRQQQFYKNGKRDSVNTTYHANGKVEAKLMYKDGELTGNMLNYNEVGELVDNDSYKNGELSGDRISLACNKVFVKYHCKENEKDGPQIYYGEGDRVACVLYYREGNLVGYSHEGKDGKLLPMIPVKNGTANIRAYYSNGKIAAEINTVQSEFAGVSKIYYSNGNVAEERNSKEGLLDGPFKRYMPDGKLVYEHTYWNNEDAGPEKTYDKNGSLLVSKEFYCGVPHGQLIINDPVTHKTTKYTYHYGELINVKE